VPTPEEIVRFHDPADGKVEWLFRSAPGSAIVVVPYDPGWPGAYARVAARIRDALGERIREIAHVGSTSVPGLHAKPVIDIDLTVDDPRDEDAYVPALATAGFRLKLREPGWHEHRMLTSQDPLTNLHVFGPDCPEVVRHRMFREWLLTHPEDLALYQQAKVDAAERTGPDETGMDYNARKEPVIVEIYDRMFRAHGLLP
jgi:GrpB-like predicted nucleotidyltransferase (UPF0157 family)